MQVQIFGNNPNKSKLHTQTGTPDQILVMPFTTQSRIFSLLVCYLKTWSLKYIELRLCLLFFVSMNLVFHTSGRTQAEMFENRVLRNIYIGLRERRWKGTGENCTVKSFMMCTPHQILRWSNWGGWDGLGMWHIQKREIQSIGGETWRKETTLKTNTYVGR